MKLFLFSLVSLVASCGSKTSCTLHGDGCNSTDVVVVEKTTVVTGTPGPAGQSTTGPQGNSGNQGEVGQIGLPGEDADSCTVVSVSYGAEVTCPGQATVLIHNGAVGATGATGAAGVAGSNAPPTPYTITELVDPCGHMTDHDEVLLRTSNNKLIVLYADNIHGDYPRLSILGPGNYTTSDGTGCGFTVDANLNITNEHY